MPDSPVLENHDEASDTPEVRALDRLSRRVSVLNVWLAVVTTALVLMLVASCVPVALISVLSLGSSSGPDASQVPAMRAQVESAFGSRLESVDVRPLNVTDPSLPRGMQWLGLQSSAVYVEVKLKGSPVVMADTFGMSDGPSTSGFLPTAAALTDRMTDEEFGRMLSAYAAQTSLPLAAVKRYTPFSAVDTDTVTIGGKTYPTSELWSARVGRLVKGDSVSDRSTTPAEAEALVFHQDPKTGEFVFLGKESVPDPSAYFD